MPSFSVLLTQWRPLQLTKRRPADVQTLPSEWDIKNVKTIFSRMSLILSKPYEEGLHLQPYQSLIIFWLDMLVMESATWFPYVKSHPIFGSLGTDSDNVCVNNVTKAKLGTFGLWLLLSVSAIITPGGLPQFLWCHCLAKELARRKIWTMSVRPCSVFRLSDMSRFVWHVTLPGM